MATQQTTARAGNGGFLDSYFSISQRGSTVRQELLAGLTTFLAMVYSIIVVPNMLGAAGFEQGPVFVATCLIAAFGSPADGALGQAADGHRLCHLSPPLPPSAWCWVRG